jgi:GTP cyclohydrolase I
VRAPHTIFGKAHVAYIPNGKMLDLVKYQELVFARRMQVQERLTDQIKDCIQEALEPLGVAVVEADMCIKCVELKNKILLRLHLHSQVHLEKIKLGKNSLAISDKLS